MSQSVLAHYAQLDPTCRLSQAWEGLRTRHEDFCLYRLHVPLAVFRGARVLDAGCGSGEYSAIYASWGAHVLGVDGNPSALEHARQLAATLSLSIAYEQHDLNDWEPPQASAEFVICQGVLQHLERPRQALESLVRALVPGGFLIAYVSPYEGNHIRRLMRQVIRASNPTLSHAVALTRQFFSRYLDRAVTHGQRTAEQVVWDNFLTPRLTPFHLSDMLGWFHDSGLRLYRSWPTLEPPDITPSLAPTRDWTDATHRNRLAAEWVRWLSADDFEQYDGVGQWWLVGIRTRSGGDTGGT